MPARVWRALVGPTLRSDHSAQLAADRHADARGLGRPRRHRHASRPGRPASRPFPAARLSVYPGGGHAFHWEDPATFARDLVAFVDERVAGLA